MERIDIFFRDYWQYATLILGAGFIIFGLICNKVRLPRFFTNNPDATYSLGLRIIYILLGIGALLFSLYYIFSGW